MCACNAPAVTPTQSEVVTEPVVSEVVTLATEQPTLESTMTNTRIPGPTPTPTQTPIPSPTSTPKPTNTPAPPNVEKGTIYYLWGSGYNSSPYLVWGAQFRDTMNGNCQGFICGGNDLREYDANVWQFLGRGEYRRMVFTFDKPLDTFVITYKSKMGFDAISGTTVDGKTVAYGYLVNGKITASYMDGSNFSIMTIINAENNFVPVTEPCGIIDPNPDGDNHFNLSKGKGGIVWNFLDRGFYNSAYATRKGYSLTSLTIISQPVSRISSDQICP